MVQTKDASINDSEGVLMADVEERDLGWKKFVRDMNRLHKLSVAVGLPEGEDVKARTSKGSGRKPFTKMSDLVLVGAVHEFGAPNRGIPERSWLRSAFDRNRQRIEHVLDQALDHVMTGRFDVQQALSLVGESFTNVVKRNFLKITPALSDKTIKRKKSSKPLIDSGQMRASITWVIRKP